jgi:hypothetical protein
MAATLEPDSARDSPSSFAGPAARDPFPGGTKEFLGAVKMQ